MKKTAYPIQPIRTEANYQAALKLVAPYFDNEPELDSDAGAHFEATKDRGQVFHYRIPTSFTGFHPTTLHSSHRIARLACKSA